MHTTRTITPSDLGLPTALPMPKRKRAGIGLVGVGGIAAAHVANYDAAGLNIVAAADISASARKRAESEFKIGTTYEKVAELLADERVEVVDLLTQPSVREEAVLAAVDAGKPIITEKPLTQDLAEGERMVVSAEAAGVPFAVHQNYRWMTMNFLAAHIVRRGFIGEPFFAGIEIYGRQDVDLEGHHFYSVCDNFLTVQWDNHLSDLLRSYTGRDPRRIFARTGRAPGQNFRSDNLLTVITDFGEGLTGHVLHSELTRSHMLGQRSRIDGTKGTLMFDFNENLTIESEELGDGAFQLDATEFDQPGSFAGSMADFLIAIENEREPTVSARRNMVTIRTIVAEDESAKAGGRWVEVT